MKSRSLVRTTCVFIALALAAGSLSSASPVVATSQSENWNHQAEASKLLKQVQSTATRLTLDAEKLHSYTRAGLSRTSHSAQITLVKEHINTIGTQLDRLQAIRHLAAPWQQQAIDSVLPAAVNLAAHTEAAILHLNDSARPLWDSDYRAHLQAISDRSDQVKDTIDLHLDLAAAEDRLEQLRERANTLGS